MERVRRAAACVALTARQHRQARLGVAVDPSWGAPWIEALAEGLTIANYDNGHYKSRGDAPHFVGTIEVATAVAGAAAMVERGCRVGEAVNAARVLINEPGNRLTPRQFAERGAAVVDVPGVTTEVLDEQRIEELGMGLLLGVARGSDEPPRLMVLALRAGRRAGTAGARAGRQGHHVRHRRHLDQAGRRHGADEGRHGRRRGGASRRCARSPLERLPIRVHRASCRRPRTCRAAGRSSRATC